MLGSILVTGVALGSIYALIGVTYNVMFSASRVMSFTAGQVGMLGGVLGAMFIARLGVPVPLGLLATLAACAAFGMVTELVAVRPVLASLDKHLYVLVHPGRRAAGAAGGRHLVGHRAAALSAARRVSRLAGIEERFWLPPLACAAGDRRAGVDVPAAP